MPLAFIKDRRSFKTKYGAEVLSYDLVFDSIYDDNSSMTVHGTEVGHGTEGDYLLFDGGIWVISTVSPGKSSTTLTLLNILSIFDRDIVFDGDKTTNVVTRLLNAITSEFKNQSDEEYAMPWLQISCTAASESIMVPDVEQGLWSVKSFIRKLWRITDIRTTITASKDGLHVAIENADKPQKTVIIDDGHTMLDSVSFSHNSIAKVTTVQGSDVRHWYIDKDGNISNTKPSDRVTGKWTILPVSGEEDVVSAVKDEFAQNSYSHKITFYSDKKLALRDTLRVRLDNDVLSSYVAYIGKNSKDSRYYIKSGELLTTLTEKISAIKMSGGSVAESSEAEYASTAGYAETSGTAQSAVTAETAESATTAETATKAVQDGNGNNISETYAKSADIPSKTSQLENDRNFITLPDVPVKTESLPNGTDLNTVTAPGFYRINDVPVNGENKAWCQMLVVRGAADTIGQIIIPYDGNGTLLYRGASGIGGTPNWQSWKYVSTLNSQNKVEAVQTESYFSGFKTANYTVNSADRGTIIGFNSTNDLTVNLPSLGVGAELEVVRWGTGKLTVTCTQSGQQFRWADSSGATKDTSSITISCKYGCVSLKQMTDASWLVKGDVSS